MDSDPGTNAGGDTNHGPPRAGTQEWLGMAVLTLPTLLLSVDLSVLYLALPHLSADLQPTGTQQLWIMDIYGFMIVGFLVTMGTLGDRIGRRRLLMIGAAAFGGASVVAAYSTSAEMLIAARALLGIAGASLMPSTLALISNMFRDPRQRVVAIALWVSYLMSGMALGPLIGGIILSFFWWGSVFLLGVPIMALLLITAPLLLPEYRAPGAERLDLTSVALSLATILPVIYGFKHMAEEGPQITSVVGLAIGLAFGVVFVRRQRRLTHPLLDLALFRSHAFSAAMAIMLLGSTTMGGIYLFVTQYLQTVEELSPMQAGLWLVPSAVAMIVGSLMASTISRRVRPGTVIAVGMVVATVGYLILVRVSPEPGVAMLVIGISVVYFGTGPLGALSTNLIVGSAPPRKAGAAASLSETSAEFGIALGVAGFGSIGTAVYRSHMSDAVPADVPPAAAEAGQNTIAEAVSAAAELPADLSEALLGPAREAFTSGLNISAAVAAALSIGLAILAEVVLRHVRPSGHSPDDGGHHGNDEAPNTDALR